MDAYDTRVLLPAKPPKPLIINKTGTDKPHTTNVSVAPWNPKVKLQSN